MKTKRRVSALIAAAENASRRNMHRHPFHTKDWLHKNERLLSSTKETTEWIASHSLLTKPFLSSGHLRNIIDPDNRFLIWSRTMKTLVTNASIYFMLNQHSHIVHFPQTTNNKDRVRYLVISQIYPKKPFNPISLFYNIHMADS